MELKKVELMNKKSNGVLNLGKVSNLRRDVSKTLVLHAKAIVHEDHKPIVYNLIVFSSHGYSHEYEDIFNVISEIRTFTSCPDKGVETHSFKNQVPKIVYEDVLKELYIQIATFLDKNNMEYKRKGSYKEAVLLFRNKLKNYVSKIPTKLLKVGN